MLDEAGDLGEFRRLADFLLVGIGPSVADIVGDGVVEEHGVLRHHADRGAQALLPYIPDILSVDQDRALLDIVETEQQARDRRFSRSGRPHDRNGLAGLDLEADPLQDRPCRVIGEMHVPEGDRALRDDQVRRARAVRHLLPDIEEIEHLLDIGEALTDFTIDEADEVERHGKLHQHGIDEDEVADRLRSLHDGTRRQAHADGHAEREDDALAEVQPAE